VSTQGQETSTQTTLATGLFYRDANAAIDWLERAFGFERVMVIPDGQGGVAHAEMRLGSAVIMPGSARDGQNWRSPLDLGGVSASLYLYVDDAGLPAHFERAKAAGATITLPLEKKDYGGSGYSARDPEGHEWSFGSYRAGGTDGGAR
jgi:uncharacterized glyoxalase superfamily protein PhnB